MRRSAHLLGDMQARGEPPEIEQAAGYYLQALALAEELGMRPLQAHCHRGLGTLYATTGQRSRPVPSVHGHRDVRIDGDDLLAPPDGGGTGAGGRVMTMGRAICQSL